MSEKIRSNEEHNGTLSSGEMSELWELINKAGLEFKHSDSSSREPSQSSIQTIRGKDDGSGYIRGIIRCECGDTMDVEVFRLASYVECFGCGQFIKVKVIDIDGKF